MTEQGEKDQRETTKEEKDTARKCDICKRVCSAICRIYLLGGRTIKCINRNSAFIMAIATIAIAILATLQWITLGKIDETNRATQRAFVYVSGIEFQTVQTDDGEIQWWVIPRWENSGNTPTKFLKVESYCPFVRRGEEYFQYDKLQPVNIRTVGPKQTIQGITCIARTEQLLAAQRGEHDWYWTARATYRDIFDPNYLHVTEYCFYVRRIVSDVTDANVSLGIVGGPCEKHNCADKECETQG